MFLFIIGFILIAGLATFITLKIVGKPTEGSTAVNAETTVKSAEQSGTAAAAPTVKTKINTGGAFRKVIAPFLKVIGFNGLLGGTEAETVQEFLPFEKIEDSMICLRENEKLYFRMLLECTSINYALKTDEERDIVDSQFRSAVTGWNFPWGIYVQTREMDNRALVEQTREDITNISLTYPAMAAYGQAFLDFVTKDSKRVQNKTLIKKKYIIICCNNANGMTELDDEEKQDWAFNQLYMYAQNVISSLSRMGISAHVCRNWEISEVIYQAFNKKTGGAVDGITTTDFMKGSVLGDSDGDDLDKNSLQNLITEFVNQLDVHIINNPDAEFDERARASEVERKARELYRILDQNPASFSDESRKPTPKAEIKAKNSKKKENESAAKQEDLIQSIYESKPDSVPSEKPKISSINETVEDELEIDLSKKERDQKMNSELLRGKPEQQKSFSSYHPNPGTIGPVTEMAKNITQKNLVKTRNNGEELTNQISKTYAVDDNDPILTDEEDIIVFGNNKG